MELIGQSLSTTTSHYHIFIGIIPSELALLPNYKELDVSNNQLYETISPLKSNVLVKTEGNIHIGKANLPTPKPDIPSGSTPYSSDSSGGGQTHKNDSL